MFRSKVAAMKRIAEETDQYTGAKFPLFMNQTMKTWEREGLITVDYNNRVAKITDKGRQLAKKAM